MKAAYQYFLALAVGFSSVAVAFTDNQVNANIDYGTFLNPSAIVRPKFRYWLPDSSVDSNVVKKDIESSASIGAGGVELLPFFQYGGRLGPQPPGANWAISNFGTPMFSSVFQAILEAHKENGLVLDFAMGIGMGQGVPASTDDEGLQWDLVPVTAPVPDTGVFDSVIPGWGDGELVAFVSAEVVSTKTVTIEAMGDVSPVNITYDQYTLRNGSLLDHTASVEKPTGRISIHFRPSSNDTTRTHRVFAFYQKLTLNKNLNLETVPDTTIFDNGSYIVDHYSGQGAETTARFWETYILSDSIKELLMEVGNCGWEDSMEMTSNISWSRSMPDRFKRLMGYSIGSVLPLLAFGQNNQNTQAADPGSFQCILDSEDRGVGFVNDFHTVLADGYREYVQTLVNWTNNILGLQYSAQPSYNLPMDMLATVPYLDVPECETLAFNDNIDAYRQFAGPANLAGRRVISNEIGAVQFNAFRYPVKNLLFSAKRGFAGGVNRFVLHGQAFTGDYYATTWPGYVPWSYSFTESWNDKQPVWDHGLSDAMMFLGRTQQILQTGTPRVDIAIYWKQSITTLTQGYNTTDLINAGWSYSYISPDNFVLPQAIVKDGVLAPHGPAWKAILVHCSQNISMAAVEKLSEYAASGLPILLIDGKPGFYPTGDPVSEGGFDSRLAALAVQENVHSVVSTDLMSALSALGLTPRIATHTNGTLYTAWRETPQGNDYAYIYSDVVASSGELVIQTTKTPYWLDAWTGQRSPVLIYQREGSVLTIPLTLAANQTAILAFSDSLSAEIATPLFHLTGVPSQVIACSFTNTSGFTVNVAASTVTGIISASTGKNITIISADVPASFSLTNWTLIAEHWEAPANMSDATVVAAKRNTTHQLGQLNSWLTIPELTNTSGVGYYSTILTWPPLGTRNVTQLGAYITITDILNTARLYVNGQRAPALDVVNAVMDVSSFLITGENEILIEVPTIMWNYLKSILGKTLNVGMTPLLPELVALGIPAPSPLDVGLVGNVLVTPFKRVTITG